MASMKVLRDANKAQRRRLEQAEALLRQSLWATYFLAKHSFDDPTRFHQAIVLTDRIEKFLGTPIDMPKE